MRILLVEDDSTSRLFMKTFLSKYGDCDLANNGIEAIDRVSEALGNKCHYQLICLDVMMPKVDGIKALKSIREMEASKECFETPAKVIMTTALNDHATVDNACNEGADAYAWKPIDMEAFNKILIKLELIEE